VAHSLRDTMARHVGSDLGLLKIDFKNAFNLVDRAAFMRASCSALPRLSKWTNWCYSNPSLLLYDHQHVFWSSSGVQQGDPLGPLYFCFGLRPLVDEISALNPCTTSGTWMMAALLRLSLFYFGSGILSTKGPSLGLHLNPAKCEWSWLNPSTVSPSPISGVPLVPTDKVCMLGVPLGSDTFSASFVDNKLLSRLSTTVSNLEDFQDSQAALFLLRTSSSITRATHFMRTTPLAHWEAQAVQFDDRVRQAAGNILGFPFPDHVYTQACLTPSLGGLGLRRVQVHAPAAFAASFRESGCTAGEEWIIPPTVLDHFGSQKKASFRIDQTLHASLLASAPDPRERQRLARLVAPHSGAFITAVPSSEDGTDTVMRPRNFQVAVGYRLGVPVVSSPFPCPLCEQSFDIRGDHAACCTRTGDVVVRHNRIRNLLDRVCHEGLLEPQLEKKGILGPTSGRRPGDVTLPIWADGKRLAIDVAVTSPYSRSPFFLPRR